MFDVYGDEIVLNGIRVGWIDASKHMPGAAIDAIALLRTMPTEDEFSEACEEARMAGYDEGEQDGIETGREQVAKEFERKREEADETAFNEGRAAALVDMERAGDVARVDALLDALRQAHDVIRAPLHKRNPSAKVSELKNAMAGACTMLRLALNAYERVSP